MTLLTPTGTISRAVVADAHRQVRLMKAHGWLFGRYLAFPSSKARAMAAHPFDWGRRHIRRHRRHRHDGGPACRVHRRQTEAQ